MDTGEGNFAGVSERKFQELNLKKANGLFKVGETVNIHGSDFKIKEIHEDGKLNLELISDSEKIKALMTNQPIK